MKVKKIRPKLPYNRCWLWLPLLISIGLSAAILLRSPELYWGPADSDLVNQFYPWHVFIHRWLTRGVFPWWDPHVFSGYPTLETQQMLALNPIHLISMTLPAHWGLPLQMALHTIVAAAGMGLALWKWGRTSPMAAAVGAGVWAFGALFAVRVTAGHFTVVAGIAWWPVAALSLLRLVRLLPTPSEKAPGRNFAWSLIRQMLPLELLRRSEIAGLVVIAALSRVMVVLAGGPQYMVYLFYIDMAILLAVRRRGTMYPALGITGITWTAAMLISAPQWLPAAWYLPYSGRAGSRGLAGLEFDPVLNIWLESLMPYPFGDDINNGHLHFKNVWETATYPGIFGLVATLATLAAGAMWRLRAIVPEWARRRLTQGVSPLMLAGCVIFIAGFYMMVGGWLPGFGGFREATKARAVCAFAMALMSASAFDYVVRHPQRVKYALWFSCLLVLMGLLHAWKFTEGRELQALVRNFGPPMDPNAGATYEAFMQDPSPAARRFMMSYGWAAGFLCVILAAAGALRFFPRTVAVLLLLCAVGDPLASHGRNWLARHPWNAAGLPPATAEYFAPRLQATRDAGELPWRVTLHSGVINRTHHLEGLYEYHGYDPLMPAQAVNRLLVKGASALPDDQRPQARSQIVAAGGIRFDTIQWWPGDPRAGDAGDNPISANIVEVTTATLFEITRQVQPGAPGEGTFGPDLNGTHYVLPAETGGSPGSPVALSEDFSREVARLSAYNANNYSDEIRHFDTGRPDEWGVQVSLAAPALVIYKGTWLPGWRVKLDGEHAGRALYVNNWMCGALVPAGEHTVVFRYRPVGMGWAVCIAGVGMVLLAGLWIRSRRKLVRH